MFSKGWSLKLNEIAVNVVKSSRGSFLKAFADAWLKADPENKDILRPAWIVIIDKYQLDQEYEETQRR